MRKICLSLLLVTGSLYAQHVHIGSAYYPEQSGKESVAPDARLMKEAGFNVARMGDFAWHNMEPREGVYTLDWLQHAVTELAAQNIQTLLCTPTAAIPKWLHDKHPDIMQVTEQDTRKPYGKRRHACLNHPVYQEYCVRIATEMARAFQDHPAVIGFQIDNELMAESPYCYCPHCRNAFAQWVKRKYQTIEKSKFDVGAHLLEPECSLF
ncbi:MAG: beta-galactosidase [Bacteroides sp.]|nr:beta-galactosidase [Bacteroides sp.]